MANKKRLLVALGVLGVAVSGLAGCASQGVTVLNAGASCLGGKDKEVRWLASPAELAGVWQASSGRLPPAPVPAADFSRQAVLFLAEAERPTAGYGLDLANPAMTVTGRVAGLSLNTAQPSGLVAQVVTRPCLFLGLPEGTYDSIEIRDQGGALWGVATRPSARRPD
jgi:hypothetical protein